MLKNSVKHLDRNELQVTTHYNLLLLYMPHTRRVSATSLHVPVKCANVMHKYVGPTIITPSPNDSARVVIIPRIKFT